MHWGTFPMLGASRFVLRSCSIYGAAERSIMEFFNSYLLGRFAAPVFTASTGSTTLARAPGALFHRRAGSPGCAPFQDELGVSRNFEFKITVFVEDTGDFLTTRAHVCGDLRQASIGAGHDAHMARTRLVAKYRKAKLLRSLL